ncbi:PBECR4 domain-containing protein [Rummeliibacillus pycnus]|uniref:PBECR4 domain-containing protein n=1 Tax=Rummeliibacillus pycnus TaxID=101070 RepID=UPI003D2DA994
MKFVFGNIHELKETAVRPSLSNLTLKLLSEYYEAFLMPFIYKYELDDGTYLKLRCNDYNFAHLLGLEDIVKNELKRQRRSTEIPNYKGKVAFDSCKNGTLTFDSIRAIDRKKLNSYRLKSMYFFLIPELLINPDVVEYDQTKSGSKINANLLFYKEEFNAYVHLGIIKESEKSGFFVPSTMLIEIINEDKGKDGTQHIKNQTPKNIIKENRIIIN